MKSISRVVLVVAMVAGLFTAAVSAGAQEANPTAYLANVNGSSTNPVDVAVGGEPIATGLAYAEAAAVPYIPAGSSEVSFTADEAIVANVPIKADAGSAGTVVSGFGDTGGSAYPVEVAPIDAGMARLRVWNATDATVQVQVGSIFDSALDPGQGTELWTLPAGDSVPVVVDGVEVDVEMAEDSYTDAFAVNDSQTPAVAVSTIPSMTDLIATIVPPVPEGIPVPDVAGQTAADAQAAIEGVGLVAALEDTSSDDVETGLVTETSPAAGTEVEAGSTVTVFVSTGPATVAVPDVVGQVAANAQAALEGEGFVVTTTEVPSDEVEEGLVIATNPTAGIEVAPGTTVDMAVSTGPADVVVPEFLGLTIDEATTLAEELGLTITFVEDTNRPDPEGVVVGQDPAPGASVEAGSEVVAQLSPLVGVPYVVVNLDTNRLLTTTGLNFLPGSTVTLTVVGTDLGASLPVDEDGVWWESFQLGDAQTEVETLVVEGTAADGSTYRATFQIPPAGGSADEPTEGTGAESDGGFPWWGWLLIGLAVVGIGVLVWWLVAGRDSTTVTQRGTGGTPPPPPPPASGG
jgi:beta-lactam-binding protein with PASTA domain